MIRRYSLPEMAALFSEEAKFDSWLKVELLVCEEQARRGEVPKQAFNKIKSKAKYSVSRIEELEKLVKHDLNAFLEAVGESVGPEARYLHRGLTSYDVEDTALSWRLVKACDIITDDLKRLLGAVKTKIKNYKNTIMIGRTHGVHAEPITLGFKFLVWHEEIKRNLQRIKQAREMIAVGKLSGAVGTFANISPAIESKVCSALGLKPAVVSTQILQRDRHAQLVVTLALIASSLEKFSTEIRNLQRTEILELEEYFSASQKGSSAMPHKRNPIISEQISGLARVMRGYALTSLENISLWHERDLTNSSVERIVIPDSLILCDYMLNTFTRMFDKLTIYPDHMAENIEKTYGAIFAQRLMLALTKAGMHKEKAYRLAQSLAMEAWEKKRPLKILAENDPMICQYLEKANIEGCFDANAYLKNLPKIFKRAAIEKK